jgi:hypothetical protein
MSLNYTKNTKLKRRRGAIKVLVVSELIAIFYPRDGKS